jgi:hypothetical protein
MVGHVIAIATTNIPPAIKLVIPVSRARRLLNSRRVFSSPFAMWSLAQR